MSPDGHGSGFLRTYPYTSVPDLPSFNRGRFLGAWEVWRLARAEARAGRQEVPLAALQDFIEKQLAYLNTVADDHLSRG